MLFCRVVNRAFLVLIFLGGKWLVLIFTPFALSPRLISIIMFLLILGQGITPRAPNIRKRTKSFTPKNVTHMGPAQPFICLDVFTFSSFVCLVLLFFVVYFSSTYFSNMNFMNVYFRSCDAECSQHSF